MRKNHADWCSLFGTRSANRPNCTEVPDGATVNEAIARSGILKQFPNIDLSRQRVGVFGLLVKLDTTLRPGDRVEIYREIIADPETVPRRDMVEE